MFSAIERHPATFVVLLLIIVVLFGANKLPMAARSLGRSMRIFKSEVEAMQDDKPASAAKETPAVERRVIDADIDQSVTTRAQDDTQR